ncbi:hypothetical protein GCM10010452_01870 [Crossiella cryophila]|uniref:flavodoxin-dependent (E)-4-hydroxy-3-methylbut-2-enyl-diphosphate synthase n=1 Tax=Crossiella cryophila TaxID=43355 RepID=UPI0031F0437B
MHSESTARRFSRRVAIGQVTLGPPHPVAVQAATAGADLEVLLDEIVQAAVAGAELIRIEHADRVPPAVLAAVVRESPVPVVAEIPAAESALRQAAAAGGAAVRIVVGREAPLRTHAPRLAGAALETVLLVELAVPEGGRGSLLLAEAGLRCCALLAGQGLTELCLAVLGPTPALVLATARLLAVTCDYPLQFALAATSAGATATARAAALCGQLLAEGIGDSIWISAAGAAVMQAHLGRQILLALQEGS